MFKTPLTMHPLHTFTDISRRLAYEFIRLNYSGAIFNWEDGTDCEQRH